MTEPTEEVPAAVIWLIEEMYKRWLQDQRRERATEVKQDEEKAARAA